VQQLSRRHQSIHLGFVPPTTNLKDPYISAVFTPTFKGLPAALAVTDEDDFAPDEGQLYADHLKSAGVAVRVSSCSSLILGFFLMAGGRRSAVSAGF
jgi:acetyl esterase/lipase